MNFREYPGPGGWAVLMEYRCASRTIEAYCVLVLLDYELLECNILALFTSRG